MIRFMLSAFQSIMPAQLNVKRRIMSPSENFLKDALGLELDDELELE